MANATTPGAATAGAPRADSASSSLTWVDAGKGYTLALDDGKLVCRNPQGKVLASVPKNVRESAAANELLELRDYLKEHQRECSEAVDTWMSRSLPVPRGVLEAVWDDPSWRQPLENAVVWPVDAGGKPDAGRAGFLRGIDAARGIGVVTLDGETVWIDAPALAIPHPVLLGDELGELRELATELKLTQGLSQLFRETFGQPEDVADDATEVEKFRGGEFETLMQAVSRARSQGFRVRGGYASCPIWEGEKTLEARFWIGADYPEEETSTGELIWVDGEEQRQPIAAVGPVALSEGLRMASLIYAGRRVEKEEEEN